MVASIVIVVNTVNVTLKEFRGRCCTTVHFSKYLNIKAHMID